MFCVYTSYVYRRGEVRAILTRRSLQSLGDRGPDRQLATEGQYKVYQYSANEVANVLRVYMCLRDVKVVNERKTGDRLAGQFHFSISYANAGGHKRLFSHVRTSKTGP